MSGDAGNPRAAPADLTLVALEMFGLARNLRDQAKGDATARVAPEAIARIAANLGLLAQAVARADRAYAEGARQRDEAAVLAPALTAEPEPEEAAPAGPVCDNCRHFRRLHTAIRPIPGAGVPDGLCGLRDPGRIEGLTRYCNRGDWCEQHDPINVTKGPGA